VESKDFIAAALAGGVGAEVTPPSDRSVGRSIL